MANPTTLSVSLEANAAGLKKGLDQARAALEAAGVDIQKLGLRFAQDLGGAQSQMSGFSAEVSKGLAKVKGFLDDAGLSSAGFGRALQALGSPAGLAAVGLAAVSAVSVKLLRDLQENAQAVRELMAVSGLGAEEADNLGDTFRVLGVGSDKLTAALFKMSAEIESGGAGFTRLGISVFESGEALKSEGALLLEARERIAKLGTASERSAALIDLFGRAGRALAPIFSMTNDEFERWRKAAEEASPWNDRLQDSVTQLSHSTALFSAHVGGLSTRLGDLLLPVANVTTQIGTAMVQGVNKAIDAVMGLAQTTANVSQFVDVKGFFGKLFGGDIKGAIKGAIGQVDQALVAGLEASSEKAKQGAATIPIAIRQQLDKLSVGLIFSTANQAIDENMAKVQAAAAIGQASAGDVARAELAAIGQRRAAENARFAGQLANIQKYGDQFKAQQKELELEHGAALSKLTMAEIKAVADIKREWMDLQTWELDYLVKREGNRVKSVQAAGAIESDLTSQLMDVYGQDTEAFVRQENLKFAATVNRIQAEVKDNQEASRLIALAWLLSSQRIENSLASAFRAADMARANLGQKSAQAAARLSSDLTDQLIEAGGTEYAAFKNRLLNEQIALRDRAFQEIGDAGERARILEQIERALTAKLTKYQQDWLKNRSGLLMTETELAEQAYVDQLDAIKDMFSAGLIGAERYNAALARLGDSRVRNLRAAMNQEIQIEAEKNARALTGFADRVSREQQLRATTAQEILRQYDNEIRRLEFVNTFSEQVRGRQLELAAQQARAQEDWLSFFTASLQQASAAAGTFWDGLRTLASSTFQNVQRAFSDFFFNVFTGKVNSLKEVWTGFLNSMLRGLADFMATRVAQGFLAMLFGAGGLNPAAAFGATAAGAIGPVPLGGAGGGAGGGGGFGLGNLIPSPSTLNTAWNWLSGGGGAAGGVGAVPGAFSGSSLTLGGVESISVLNAADFSLTGVQAAGILNPADFTLGVAPLTTGLEGASTAVSVFSTALAGVGAAVGIGLAIFDLAAGRIEQGIGGLAGAAAGAIIGTLIAPGIGTLIGAGLGAAAGGFLGGLFGGKQKSHAQRQAEEFQKAIPQFQSMQDAVRGARTPTELFKAITAFGSGSTGGTTPVASVTTFGRVGEPDFGVVGTKPGTYPLANIGRLLSNPQNVFASAQLGVEQNMLAPINAALQKDIRTSLEAMAKALQPVVDFMNTVVKQTDKLDFAKLGDLADKMKAENFEDFLGQFSLFLGAASDTIKGLNLTTQGAGGLLDVFKAKAPPDLFSQARVEAIGLEKSLHEDLGKLIRGEKVDLTEVTSLVLKRYDLEVKYLQTLQQMITSITQSIDEQIKGIRFTFLSPEEQLRSMVDDLRANMQALSGATTAEGVGAAVRAIQDSVGGLLQRRDELVTVFGMAPAEIEATAIDLLEKTRDFSTARLEALQEVARQGDQQFIGLIAHLTEQFGVHLTALEPALDQLAASATAAAVVLAEVPNFFAGIAAEVMATIRAPGINPAVPGFQEGGVMPYTGLAFLHSGERITPAGEGTEDWGSRGPSGDLVIQIVTPTGQVLTQEVIKEFRRRAAAGERSIPMELLGKRNRG